MTAVLRWPTIATERDVNQSRVDITDSRDVARLVNVFYDRVRDDDILGPIFDDIAHVDWATHPPRMYDFWQNTPRIVPCESRPPWSTTSVRGRRPLTPRL